MSDFQWRTNLEADSLSSTNPEGIRRSLLRKVDISKKLLTKALRTTEAALDATQVRYIPQKNGIVVAKSNIDHRTRLIAGDQVYRIAGLYQREEDKVSDKPEIFIQVSEKGVVSIRVGPPVRKEMPDEVVESENTLALSESVDQLPLFADIVPDKDSQSVESEVEIEYEKFKSPIPPSVPKEVEKIPNLGNRTTPGIPAYIRNILTQK